MSAPVRPRRARGTAPALCILAVIFWLFLGCELLVETSDLDSGCAPGTHYCPNVGCVSDADPAFGCGDASCAACPLNATNTIVSCNATKCETTCTRGFGCPSCDTFILTDRQNCGSCGAACGAGEICCNGTCNVPPCAN
jgi:hypothetical protein